MRRPGGYATVTEPGKRTMEVDTFTCAHCNRVVHCQGEHGQMASAYDVGGLCKSCMGLVCERCAAGGCSPLAARIEASERRRRYMSEWGN